MVGSGGTGHPPCSLDVDAFCAGGRWVEHGHVAGRSAHSLRQSDQGKVVIHGSGGVGFLPAQPDIRSVLLSGAACGIMSSITHWQQEELM